MRVRLRFDAREYWVVESKPWYNFFWKIEASYQGDDAYERAHFYARAFKHPKTEEIA